MFNRISQRNEFFYPVIALFTFILLIWYHYGMNKTLDVYPNLIHQPLTLNDSINGGRSIGTIKNSGNVLQLDCQTLKSPNLFSFCSVLFPLVNNAQGIDLSSYHSLTISFSFESNIQDTVIVYLLNQEKNNHGTSIKRANHRTVFPAKGMSDYKFDLGSFSVPSWWLFGHAGKVSDGDPNLNNITDIQIATGDNTFERKETIKIKKIALQGKWLSSQVFYVGIIVIWSLIISIHLLRALIALRKKLSAYNLKTSELKEINQLLSIEKDKYESMAKIDPLTKALNRAGIRDILDESVQHFEENQSACSIILLDIDHFKEINDQYGHDVGDEVLIKLVNCIKSHIRSSDSLVRWGGEEFVLICPKTPIQVAMNIAEKHRSTIANMPFIEQAITCSFGVSELKSSDIAACFKEADIALYQAKAQGRNCVVGH